MHPVIRIVTFVVFSLGVVFGNVQHLLLALLLLVLGYSLWQPTRFSLNWKMLRRMRWLFLSILVIYLWFTPGQLLIPAIGAWSPSWEGIRLGVYRVASLVFIVLAVNLLIKSNARDELIAGIMWLLRPLRLLGLPDERLAVRIALTFDVVHEVQGVYEAPKSEASSSSTEEKPKSFVNRLRARLWSIGVSAVSLFEQVIQRAENTPTHEVTIPIEGRPPYYQWGLPILLVLLNTWLHHTLLIMMH